MISNKHWTVISRTMLTKIRLQDPLLEFLARPVGFPRQKRRPPAIVLERTTAMRSLLARVNCLAICPSSAGVVSSANAAWTAALADRARTPWQPPPFSPSRERNFGIPLFFSSISP